MGLSPSLQRPGCGPASQRHHRVQVCTCAAHPNRPLHLCPRRQTPAHPLPTTCCPAYASHCTPRGATLARRAPSSSTCTLGRASARCARCLRARAARHPAWCSLTSWTRWRLRAARRGIQVGPVGGAELGGGLLQVAGRHDMSHDSMPRACLIRLCRQAQVLATSCIARCAPTYLPTQVPPSHRLTGPPREIALPTCSGLATVAECHSSKCFVAGGGVARPVREPRPCPLPHPPPSTHTHPPNTPCRRRRHGPGGVPAAGRD